MNKYKNNYTKRNKLLRKMGFSSYNEYLKSDTWEETKQAFNKYKKFREHKCFCGVKKNIVIHHIRYDNIGKETPRDLLAVCSFHHEMIHNYEREHNCSIAKATKKVKLAVLKQKGLYKNQKQRRAKREKKKEVKRIWTDFGFKTQRGKTLKAKGNPFITYTHKKKTRESIVVKYRDLIKNETSLLKRLELTKEMNTQLKAYL